MRRPGHLYPPNLGPGERMCPPPTIIQNDHDGIRRALTPVRRRYIRSLRRAVYSPSLPTMTNKSPEARWNGVKVRLGGYLATGTCLVISYVWFPRRLVVRLLVAGCGGSACSHSDPECEVMCCVIQVHPRVRASPTGQRYTVRLHQIRRRPDSSHSRTTRTHLAHTSHSNNTEQSKMQFTVPIPSISHFIPMSHRHANHNRFALAQCIQFHSSLPPPTIPL